MKPDSNRYVGSVPKGEHLPSRSSWTETQWKAEWQYIYTERLGLLLDGTGIATPEQQKLAKDEADRHIEALKKIMLDQ